MVIPGLGKAHPEDKDEFECVVEWEPIHSVDGALKDRQEGVDNPILHCCISK